MTTCSTNVTEPLAGTAKTGTLYVALEHLHGWGRDVSDGEAFGHELNEKITAHLRAARASLQLIRKPGRSGQHRKQRWLYLCYTGDGHTEPWMEKMAVDGPEDLLRLDLSGPGRNTHLGAQPTEDPIVLVCTHGKRDKCCALKGRPLAAAMQTCFYGDDVWESSHTKGHRFAPSMILLPWGYSFGRLASGPAIEMLKTFHQGQLFLPGNRGRGCFDAPGQVAELVVANALIGEGETVAPGSLIVEVTDNEHEKSAGEALRRVIHPDGRTWDVYLEQRDVNNVITSCGDEPKKGRAWVAVSGA